MENRIGGDVRRRLVSALFTFGLIAGLLVGTGGSAGATAYANSGTITIPDSGQANPLSLDGLRSRIRHRGRRERHAHRYLDVGHVQAHERAAFSGTAPAPAAPCDTTLSVFNGTNREARGSCSSSTMYPNIPG